MCFNAIIMITWGEWVGCARSSDLVTILNTHCVPAGGPIRNTLDPHRERRGTSHSMDRENIGSLFSLESMGSRVQSFHEMVTFDVS